MLLDSRLVRQQAVQRAVESVIVDLLSGDPEQIFQCRMAVPIFSDMGGVRNLVYLDKVSDLEGVANEEHWRKSTK